MRRHLRKYLPDHEAIRANRWLRPFENTLLHPRPWDLNRHSAAGAVAAGMLCGLIPGPLQMLGAAICAVIFRVVPATGDADHGGTPIPLPSSCRSTWWPVPSASG
jgi:uncharacterized protein (DUF2062 family)